ncbi:hypothetical protein T07_2557 [Trichinella nelsoni]|uniref:Uncharacterized protein n=1 Tax=Trichinella nelsoni TaxID=6336 RepID=A0A0V0SEC1_9BILA|nr:hypothetical protein T07_2557 [Trichinella nelsoni]
MADFMIFDVTAVAKLLLKKSSDLCSEYFGDSSIVKLASFVLNAGMGCSSSTELADRHIIEGRRFFGLKLRLSVGGELSLRSTLAIDDHIPELRFISAMFNFSAVFTRVSVNFRSLGDRIICITSTPEFELSSTRAWMTLMHTDTNAKPIIKIGKPSSVIPVLSGTTSPNPIVLSEMKKK